MSPDEIRIKLAFGLEALRRSPATGCFPARQKVIWPEFKRTRGELFAADMDGEVLGERITITRLQPTNEGIDALIEVLPWLYSVADLRHRKATFVRHYYARIGWRRVAKRLNEDGIPCSHETARHWEAAGIQAIGAALLAHMAQLANQGKRGGTTLSWPSVSWGKTV